LGIWSPAYVSCDSSAITIGVVIEKNLLEIWILIYSYSVTIGLVGNLVTMLSLNNSGDPSWHKFSSVDLHFVMQFYFPDTNELFVFCPVPQIYWNILLVSSLNCFFFNHLVVAAAFGTRLGWQISFTSHATMNCLLSNH
jgi:hypothetical protein